MSRICRRCITGDVEDPFWWTGVLGSTVPVPANLTRGLAIIINPLVRLPWLFNDEQAPAWAVDPMLFNGRNLVPRSRPGWSSASMCSPSGSPGSTSGPAGSGMPSCMGVARSRTSPVMMVL